MLPACRCFSKLVRTGLPYFQSVLCCVCRAINGWFCVHPVCQGSLICTKLIDCAIVGHSDRYTVLLEQTRPKSGPSSFYLSVQKMGFIFWKPTPIDFPSVLLLSIFYLYCVVIDTLYQWTTHADCCDRATWWMRGVVWASSATGHSRLVS